MKKLFTATFSTALVIGLAGCKSTPKADSTDEDRPRSEESTLQHIGHDAKDVGTGTLEVVGSGIDAVGKGISGALKGGKDKKADHPKKDSDHPDHPGM